ncbi:hypothetical protein AVEN_172915-1 [Araneus ventricosus]|uniref:Uncharacterized protein n=1 Tax=Araneus ventricosus TaxID=182803 RepID=A0A4Y2DF27_ARAVE|nr:hypothetical protein AVEN_172915-1 [Araneus ventricosus]
MLWNVIAAEEPTETELCGGKAKLDLPQKLKHVNTVKPISVTGDKETHFRRTELACYRRLYAPCRHWGNTASPGTFSGAGTDGNRWKQDRYDTRVDKTPSSGAAAAVVVCTAALDGERGLGAVSQLLLSSST